MPNGEMTPWREGRNSTVLRLFKGALFYTFQFMRLPIRGKYLTLEVRVCRREKKLGFYNVNYNWCKPNTMVSVYRILGHCLLYLRSWATSALFSLSLPLFS